MELCSLLCICKQERSKYNNQTDGDKNIIIGEAWICSLIIIQPKSLLNSSSYHFRAITVLPSEGRLEATSSLGRQIPEVKRAWRGHATRAPPSFPLSAVRYVFTRRVCIHLETGSRGNGVPLVFSFSRFFFFFFTEYPPCPRHHTKWWKEALSQKRYGFCLHGVCAICRKDKHCLYKSM